MAAPDRHREPGIVGRRHQHRRQGGGGLQLGAVGERHRAGVVKHQVEMRAHFLVEELDRQAIGTGIGRPVNRAQIIAGLVIPVIPEIHRLAAAAAQTAAGTLRTRLARNQQGIMRARLDANLKCLTQFVHHHPFFTKTTDPEPQNIPAGSRFPKDQPPSTPRSPRKELFIIGCIVPIWLG